MTRYLIACQICGNTTSKHYARQHSGQCKACANPEQALSTVYGRDNALIIDSGYQAYAMESGHYDNPNDY